MTESSLLIKYRPTCFEEVVGQESVVKSFFNALKKRSSHAFLFSGPPGTGKTTLARLGAAQLGCKSLDLTEVDCATYTGIDDMRSVADALTYSPLGDGKIKAIIADEVHMLSKQAFASLLKIVEHPPSWGYWFFCTTDLAKVPAALKSRCLAYELKPVPTKKLEGFLTEIAGAEELETLSQVLTLCAKEAKGSPRQALANLGVCSEASDVAEATELLASAEGSQAGIDLARALYKAAEWEELVGIIAKLNGANPESVRHVVRGYGTSMLLKSPNIKGRESILAVLEAFSKPFNSSDGVTPLLLACAGLFG